MAAQCMILMLVEYANSRLTIAHPKFWLPPIGVVWLHNNNNNNNNAIGGLGGRHKKITINGHFRKWSISSECVTILFSP